MPGLARKRMAQAFTRIPARSFNPHELSECYERDEALASAWALQQFATSIVLSSA